MSTDTDDALRRRRERGRRSQAGFRKRQAEANQFMRDQNRSLKSAIEKLVNTTRGDEHPELLNSIFDVAEAADINGHRLMQSPAVQPRRKHISGNSQSYTSPVDSEEDITVNATTGEYTCKTDNQASSGSSPSAPSLASLQRLRCGIWLDHQHYMRVSIPPDDILPHLGKGAKTFAGIIYWCMLDHSQNKCTREHTEITALIQRGLHHSTVTEGWAITYIQAMVEARQEYRMTGSISPQYASAAEPDLGAVVRDQIKAEYHARGKDPDQWLSAMGIEKRVKSVVDIDTFTTLESVARGEGEPFLRHLFEMTMCKLSETCICFGDGPRWSVDVVDRLFLDWVHATYGLLHDED
ncbi:hypothetical protein F5Y06DRAFT_249050 [Hypoxylon sp. FL0890]|nr:hypothetical protein F5Y06DRAFT_249050 [Hypoxylon sp. FL0890]